MAFYFPKRKRKRTGKGNHLASTSSKRILIAVAIVLAAVALLVGIFPSRKPHVSKTVIIRQKRPPAETKEPHDATSEIAGHWYGLCPKNAIHSIEDFHRIVKNDPLLAKYFADFDWQKARMGRLEHAIWTHLSYRKDGKISMTRRLVRLPKGDGYITDGKRWVRTYCGNDYVLASKKETVEQIASDMTGLSGKSFKVLASGGSGSGAGADAIPEPGTFLLLATGILGFGLRRFVFERA